MSSTSRTQHSTRGKTGDRAKRDVDVNWAVFADVWQEEYQPSMDRVRNGEIPWRNLDTLHRDSLETLLDQFGTETFTENDKEWLTGA